MNRLAYRIKEAARLLGVSPAHIWRLIGAGDLAVAKVGRTTLIPADALQGLLSAPSKPSRSKARVNS